MTLKSLSQYGPNFQVKVLSFVINTNVRGKNL